MTNLEKYKDDIINEIETSKTRNLCCNIVEAVFGGYEFDCTHRNCQKCAIEITEWLAKEYEESGEEEYKMTNFEWMLENDRGLIKCLILGEKLAKQSGELTTCAVICCKDCDWHEECGNHNKLIRKWLSEEYEEPLSYADWKIDDKVEVSDDGEHWHRRYFAGVDADGKPLTWADGTTSWTRKNNEKCTTLWKCARKVEE